MVWDIHCLEDSELMDDSMNQLLNELITKVFIEQPRLHRVTPDNNSRAGMLNKQQQLGRTIH